MSCHMITCGHNAGKGSAMGHGYTKRVWSGDGDAEGERQSGSPRGEWAGMWAGAGAWNAVASKLKEITQKWGLFHWGKANASGDNFTRSLKKQSQVPEEVPKRYGAVWSGAVSHRGGETQMPNFVLAPDASSKQGGRGGGSEKIPTTPTDAWPRLQGAEGGYHTGFHENLKGSSFSAPLSPFHTNLCLFCFAFGPIDAFPCSSLMLHTRSEQCSPP